MTIYYKRLVLAGVLGAVIGTMPELVSITPFISAGIGQGQYILNYLLLPGLLVALLFAAGNGHDVNFVRLRGELIGTISTLI
jgi:hypothetical protein